MEWTKWILRLVLWAVVVGPQSAAGQDAGPSSIRVLLHDDAGVPVETLERARQEVSHVFRRSNIPFAWIGADACEGSCLRIKIVSNPLPGMSRNRQVVGIAPGTPELRGELAFVFYDRIRLHSAKLELDASQMLGHVMAHELGHLLLPHNSHSIVGVMRAGWDRTHARNAVDGLLTFTPAQTALILERLQASALPIAHAR